MEEEWRIYLKETRPDLYEDMRRAIAHIHDWRWTAGYNSALENVSAELKILHLDDMEVRPEYVGSKWAIGYNDALGNLELELQEMFL